MALPRKLKHMNLFNEGESYMGVASSVTLPKLTRKLEDWRGAGMDGIAKVDLGMGDDGIQLEWTLGGLDMTVIKQYGAVSANGIMLRFAGSYQQDDTGDTIPVEVVVRGRHEEIDMGEAKPGEDTEHKITTACTYYKLTVDGEELIEIDTLAMIFVVDGKDLMEEHRRNIGL
jgi:P2 family phage contractile tail tube protein